MAWTIDPEVVETFDGAVFTYDTLNRIFGGTTNPDANSYPYSLRAMFDTSIRGLTAAELSDDLHLFGHLEISGDIAQTGGAGLWTGVADVTAYGASASNTAAQNYTAIKAAIDAAIATHASPTTARIGMIWFPRTDDPETIYKVSPPLPGSFALPAIPIHPGLIYAGAPGVVIKREDPATGAGNESRIFGTGGVTGWASSGNAIAVIRGFTIDGHGDGHFGVDVAGGHLVIIEDCQFQYCYKDTSSYRRAGVRCSTRTVIKRCTFLSNETAIWSFAENAHVRENRIGAHDPFGGFANVGQFGAVIADGSPFRQTLIRDNLIENPLKAGSSSDTGQKTPCVGVYTNKVVVQRNVLTGFRRAHQAGVHFDANYPDVVIDGNIVAAQVPGEALNNTSHGIRNSQGSGAIISRNTVSASVDGQTVFSHGIRTEKDLGITTYGANKVWGNRVGPGVTTPYRLNPMAITETKPDIDREGKVANGVAWTTLSSILKMARGEESTVRWHPMDCGLTSAVAEAPDVAVYAAAKHQGHLYVGGYFDTSGFRYVQGLSRWSGSRWEQKAAVVGGAESIYAVYAAQDRLYVGGRWQTTIGGVSTKGVAQFDPTTGLITKVAGGFTTALGEARAFSENAEAVGVFGFFTSVDDTAGASTGGYFSMAFYDVSTDAWHPNLNNRGFYDAAGVGAARVLCAIREGNSILVGGEFERIKDAAGVTREAHRIARIRSIAGGPVTLASDGTSAFGFDGTVRAIALHGGKVIAGGDFTADESGAVDLRFLALGMVDLGAPAPVHAIKRVDTGSGDSNERYLVGGEGFVSVLSISKTENESGSLDRALLAIPVDGINGLHTVRGFYVDAERDVVVAYGSFGSYSAEDYGFGRKMNAVVQAGSPYSGV